MMYKKSMMVSLLILVALVLGFLVATGKASQGSQFGILGSSGYIESGSKFGLSVGDDLDEASSKLNQMGYEAALLPDSRRCAGRYYPEDITVEVYYNEKRHGVICLGGKDSRIVSIGWEIGGWQF